MRYRLMATYQGAPYEAGVGPSDGDVVLFAACPPPEELGFEPATGHWRKQLQVQDVQALWESRPMAMYRGQRCMVLDDLGDRLHIAYLGHDSFLAQQLGYWQVDRGVFEVVTARDEVTDLIEERADYLGHPPIGSAAEPDAAPGYSRAATNYGPANADYGPLSSDYGPATTDFGVILPASGLAPAPVSPVSGPTALPGRPAALPAADYGTTALPGRSAALPASDFGTTARPGRSAALSSSGLAAAPATREAPLPLEAAAMRAASAAANHSQTRLSTRPAPTMQAPLTAHEFSATQAPPATDSHLVAEPGPAAAFRPAALDLLAAPSAPTGLEAAVIPEMPPVPAAPAMSPPPVMPAAPAIPARGRRSARSRMATQRIFTELAGLAAIPAAAYSVGEEIDGALCLIETSAGYEVFSAAGGARHEVRFFEDEESAYFYLFGVLAAEAVRTGLLIPHR